MSTPSAKTSLTGARRLGGRLGWLAGSSLAVSLFLSGGPGCFLQDPLQRAEVEALGPEDPAVAVGPLHRPGQPCAACHRSDGPASPFVAAGTIYRDPVTTIAVADVEVLLIDSLRKSFTTKTNCVGNFYVRPGEFRAVSPFWTSVQLGEFPFEMESPIHREASCAKCHFDPAGVASAGHVFIADDETTFASIPLRPCGPGDGVSR